MVFKMADRFTVGIPDMCYISDLGLSSFLEFKVVVGEIIDPIPLADVIGRGPQFVTMQKLGKRYAGLYIIFVESKQTGFTFTVFLNPRLAGESTITITEMARRDEADVLDKFNKHGYVCAGIRQYLDPFYWLLDAWENKRCELKLR